MLFKAGAKVLMKRKQDKKRRKTGEKGGVMGRGRGGACPSAARPPAQVAPPRAGGAAWPAAGFALRKIGRDQWQGPARAREGRDWCRSSADAGGNLTGTECSRTRGVRGVRERGGGNGQSFPRSGAVCEVKVHQRREN